MSDIEPLATGRFADHLTPATEATVATWLAILAAPEQPMQRQWALLQRASTALLARCGTDWGACPADAPRAPALLEEETDDDA